VLYTSGVEFSVAKSILANNGGNCQILGTVTDAGYNISDDGRCGFATVTGAQTYGDNVNPLLDPSGLQKNGGPTETIALQADSPVIDVIPIAQCPATDQRGVARPDAKDSVNPNLGCDIGAFEWTFVCGPTPVSGCQPSAAQTARLLLSNAKNGLAWTWVSSGAVTVGDFSNYGPPGDTTEYLLCLYDASGERLSAEAAAGMCGTKPCWTSNALHASPSGARISGFKYFNQSSTPDGLTKITLQARSAGRAKIRVKGGGSNLDLPALPLTTPVRVQLRRSGSSTCWDATYSAASTNTASEFKAKSD
jgi:hypothetical protein